MEGLGTAVLFGHVLLHRRDHDAVAHAHGAKVERAEEL
jgi:hypothetical protein